MHLGLMREAEASMAAGLGGVLAGGSVYDQACARLLHAKLTVSHTYLNYSIIPVLHNTISPVTYCLQNIEVLKYSSIKFSGTHVLYSALPANTRSGDMFDIL